MYKEFGKELKWAFAEMQGSGAYSLDRNRPYDGQSHTSGGLRGQQEVHGVTMRDVADCIVRAFLSCAGMERENPIRDDLYSIEDVNELDPGAVIQNAMCNIEKMMGIFPNVPELKRGDHTKYSERKNMEKHIALLPCPFCGGEAVLAKAETEEKGLWDIDCSTTQGQCFIPINNFPFKTKDQAIKAWNRRAKGGG